MEGTKPSWDVFCRVVDNYGDAAVCWRLAQDLARDHGTVRLFIDKPVALQALRPEFDATLEAQTVVGVDVRRWDESTAWGMPADILVEGFGCGTPGTYLEVKGNAKPGSLWIVLEYLSAEAWVADRHGLPSPPPRLPLERYFYFPGFCLAYHAAASRPEWPEPVHLPPAIHSVYPESGLVLWRQTQATLVLNRRRGGAAAVLRQGEQALYHLGYTVVWRGTRYSSAGWRHDETDAGVDAAFATAQFSKVSGGLPLRWLTIPFQLVVHALVSGRLAELFQSLVKRTMISPTGTIPLTMQRRVTVDAAGIHVEDALRPARPLSITSIAVTGQATMHSPSARQDGGDIVGMAPPAQAAVQTALRDGQPVTLHWNIVPGRGRGEVRVGS